MMRHHYSILKQSHFLIKHSTFNTLLVSVYKTYNYLNKVVQAKEQF